MLTCASCLRLEDLEYRRRGIHVSLKLLQTFFLDLHHRKTAASESLIVLNWFFFLFICINMSRHSDEDQELAHEMVVEMLA